MSKIKLLALCPIPNDVCSWYRGLGPLLALEKEWSDLEVVIGGPNVDDYDWPQLKKADILFVQRPCSLNHYNAISRAKDHNIPVWIDHDDDLTAVPTYNQGWANYANAQVLGAHSACIHAADAVTVTTIALATKMQKQNANVRLILNAIDDTEYKRKELLPFEKRSKIISWRGPESHVADIVACAESVLDFSEKFPDYNFHFMGWNAWPITDRLKEGRANVFKFREMKAYMKLLQTFQAPIHIVPLVDNEFNRAKSNIAWMEATLAGSVVVAPFLPEWNRPGIIQAHPEEFGDALERAVISDLQGRLDESWDFIQTFLTLKRINQARKDLILALKR